MRAAIYVRISSDKTGAGLGVDRQRQDCLLLAEQLGATVVDTYSDNDVSAYSGRRRRAYERMIDAIQQNKIDVVLAWHPDRVHRQPKELEKYIDVCGPRGVATHCVKSGEIDLATPGGRMVARQLGAVARYESEHRSERLIRKFQQIAEEGGFRGGRRPFGFEDDGIAHRADEAELIKLAIRSIIAGQSLRSITMIFNKTGISRVRSDRPWNSTSIRTILRRPRNAGLLTYRGAVFGEAVWEPIVTKEEWQAACDVFDNPTRRTSPIGGQVKWLGSGLFLCAVCGSGLRVGTAGGKRNPAYRCPNHGTSGEKHVTRVAKTLDAWVETILIGRLSHPDVRAAWLEQTETVDLTPVRAEINRITANREAFARQVGLGEVTFAQFEAFNSSVRDRQEALEKQLADAEFSNPANKLLLASDVEEAWAKMDINMRRAVLAATVTITVGHSRPGRHLGGTYFDPTTIGSVFKL